MARTYATRAQLIQVVGARPDEEEMLDRVLAAGTLYVDFKVGNTVSDEDLISPGEDGLEVVDGCPAAYTQACLAAAVRFLRSPETPFGLTGIGEAGFYVKTSIPECDVILFGHRQSFGLG